VMDIVERLGELRLGNKEYGVVVDAIDEIEKLREERSRLRDEVKRYKPVLLQIISDYPEEGDVEDYWYWRAREALQMRDDE